MKLYNSIQSIYDKSNNMLISKEWKIYEHSDGAHFRQLKIQNIPSDSYCIDNELYKNRFTKIFENSKTINDLDCDGCAFINTGLHKHLLLVELKSKFDTTKIAEAYKQALTTLIKGHMLFSICDGYDINNVKVDILIVCLPPDATCEGWLKDNLLLLQNSSAEIKKDQRFVMELYDKKEIYTNLNSISLLSDCKFSDALKNLSIHILLKHPQSIEDRELNVSLDSIISDNN